MEKLLPIFESQLEQLRSKLEQSTTQKDITYYLNLILERSINAYKQNLTIPQIRVTTPVLDILQGGVTCLASLRVLSQAEPTSSQFRSKFRIGRFSQTQIEFAGAALVLFLLVSAMSESWLVIIAVVLMLGLVALRLSRWFSTHEAKDQTGAGAGERTSFDIKSLVNTLRENVMIYDNASEGLIAAVLASERGQAVSASSKRLDPDILEFLQQLLGMQRLQNNAQLQTCTDEAQILLKRFGVRDVWYDEQLSEDEKAMFEQIVDPSASSVICMLPAIVNEEESLLEGRILVPLG